MPAISNYRGIIPAISCPFTPDHRIDEPALRKLASWLAGHDGVVAIMTNGHTGEVFSLTPAERAEVTRIVADELKGRMPVISSIDAAVCSRLLACDSVRADRSWLPVAIWATAVLSWSTSVRTSCTTVRRLSDICCRACCTQRVKVRATTERGEGAAH